MGVEWSVQNPWIKVPVALKTKEYAVIKQILVGGGRFFSNIVTATLPSLTVICLVLSLLKAVRSNIMHINKPSNYK